MLHIFPRFKHRDCYFLPMLGVTKEDIRHIN